MTGITACGGNTGSRTYKGGVFDLRVGNASVRMEVALTPDEQMQGLMYRDFLPANQGMLFIHQMPGRMKFWMKNTYIPLEIGFFNENGILREIHPMHPQDLTMVASRGFKMKFALEVNRGWFERNNVKLGDKLRIKDVKRAMKARGYPPAMLNR